jgi:hypothetical protein
MRSRVALLVVGLCAAAAGVARGAIDARAMEHRASAYVPGASVQTMQARATRAGFRCRRPRHTNPRDTRQLTWTCTRPLPTIGLTPAMLELEALGYASGRLQVYGADAPLSGVEFNMARVRRAFALVASLPYAGARPRAAVRWVTAQLRREHPLGRRTTTIIGRARLQIFSRYDELTLAVTPRCSGRSTPHGVPIC